MTRSSGNCSASKTGKTTVRGVSGCSNWRLASTSCPERVNNIVAELAIWHATYLEISWAIIGAVGTWIATRNLQSSRRELERVEKANGNRFKGDFDSIRILAFGHYRNDLFRLGKHMTILLIGIISCISPAVNSQSQGQVSATQIVVTLGLFMIALMLVMASALDRRQREFLLKG
jgi:hypothetical protein